jgi:hypothetical protein
MVEVLDFVEDKRCFYNLNFIKSKFLNLLTMYLDLVIKLFAQQFYMMENFPYTNNYNLERYASSACLL